MPHFVSLASFTYRNVFEIHLCCYLYQLFIPLNYWTVFYCMDVSQLVYPCTSWRTFGLFTIWHDKVAITIHTQVFVLTSIIYSWVNTEEWDSWVSWWVCNLLRNRHIISQSGWTKFTFLPAIYQSSNCSTSSQPLASSFFVFQSNRSNAWDFTLNEWMPHSFPPLATLLVIYPPAVFLLPC